VGFWKKCAPLGLVGKDIGSIWADVAVTDSGNYPETWLKKLRKYTENIRGDSILTDPLTLFANISVLVNS
jgi:hypothetical protein